MSHGLPDPPSDIPAIKSLDGLAPGFSARVQNMLANMIVDGWDPVIAESLRSDARQRYLYGFGREYDDGRGIVTHAMSGVHSWHRYGLAVDVISKKSGWDASESFWQALGVAARNEGLVWGGDWTKIRDMPHVQFGPPMRQSPSSRAVQLFDNGGYAAVWKEVGADLA